MALSLFFGVKCTMYTEIIHVFVLYCIYNKLYMYVLALIVNYRIYNYEHDNIIMYVQIALISNVYNYVHKNHKVTVTSISHIKMVFIGQE